MGIGLLRYVCLSLPPLPPSTSALGEKSLLSGLRQHCDGQYIERHCCRFTRLESQHHTALLEKRKIRNYLSFYSASYWLSLQSTITQGSQLFDLQIPFMCALSHGITSLRDGATALNEYLHRCCWHVR